MNHLELMVEQLKNSCDSSVFPYETTAELTVQEGIVGQEQAVNAMEFGFKIKRHGYNIFITGMTGTGRKKYSQSLVKKVALLEEVPRDWCYLYNFEKPDQPKAVDLPAGQAIVFKENMKVLVNHVMEQIPKTLSSEEYGKIKTKLLQELQEKQNEAFIVLSDTAKQLGFSLKNVDKGLISIPLNPEGKPMEEEEFEKLGKNEAQAIEVKSKELNLMIMDMFKKLKDLEKGTQDELEKMEQNLVKISIEDQFAKMNEKYAWSKEIKQYLIDVQKDVLKNLKTFKEKDEKQSLELFFTRDNRMKDFTYKYQVNVLVDNSKTQGAPVVFETNPTYYNLIGKVEYESQLGILTTDFMKIKPGVLHRGNGGYLILQCRDLLANPFSWNGLKRALLTGKLYIENIGEQMGVIPTSTLKPDPIPLKIKAIVIGSSLEYRLLYQYDEDFRKLFKIKSDFDVEMERNEETMLKLAQIISNHCAAENLHHFNKKALSRIVDYSSRLADNQQKLSTRFNEVIEIIYEADAWAEVEGAGIVTAEHVKKAIREKIKRSNKYELKLQEMMEKDVIMIETQQSVVGQVNGLSVINMGEYSFGKPSRITVNTYVGKRGIINIEREVKMSGPIHDKGVLILSGYLGEKFGSKYPLSFSATICFEQLYEGVEGDSASSVELYGLLSSLSGIPIKQGIAVTGSVNQKGEVQPVGGLNQKIEGFYHTCRIKGLTGEQGVIIPQRNIINLMLDDEVIAAVKEGKFHIYAVKNIEEGMEILTGIPVEEVFELVQEKVREIYEYAREGNRTDCKQNGRLSE